MFAVPLENSSFDSFDCLRLVYSLTFISLCPPRTP